MGLLNESDQHQKQTSRYQWLATAGFKAAHLLLKAVFLLSVLGLLCLILAVIAVDLGGLSFLRWTDHHPAFAARYDPHHWLSRAVALMLLILLVHQARLVLSQVSSRLLIWLPWWRRSPSTEADPPAA